MGLPIFREPEPAEGKRAPPSDAPLEAQSRSAIRRQPAVRRPRLSSQHAYATAHESGRPPVPPPMFFSFLRSNPGIQDIYDRSSHRERSDMIEQFMRSRRVRASDLRPQQLSASGAPAVNAYTRRHHINRRHASRPDEHDLEDATADDPTPASFAASHPPARRNFRPRSRRGHDPSNTDPHASPYGQGAANEEVASRRGSTGTQARDPLAGSEWSPAHNAGHWETLLTTIAPDPSLPSAESSFTSAAASFRHDGDGTATGPSNPGRSWQEGYVRLRSPNAAPPPALMSPPLSVSPNPHQRSADEQIPPSIDNICDSESEGHPETDIDGEPTGDVGFVTIMERMIRTGRSSREISSELRDTSWDSISNSSVVSNARRELEILARGGDVPDSFWESAGLMTVLEYERRIADALGNGAARR